MSVFVVLGLSHHTAGLDLRERFAIPQSALARTADRARAIGCRESFVLSTCNRVELYATVESEAVAERLPEVLGEGDAAVVRSSFYLHRGDDALRHLFRVAASLDSLVVGEAQILGQMKEAYEACKAGGLTGPVLGQAVERAFAVARRVRAETRIGEEPVSVSSVAVDLARQIFGDLSGRTALLVGAGEMGELAARHLQSAGVRELLVANRSFERAVEVAQALNAHPRDLGELPRLLVQADVVLTSTGAVHHLIDKPMMVRALKERKYRPVFLIDIAVPRNIDPAVDRLDNVFRYDVDNLQAIAQTNLESRRREAQGAEALVAREVARFVQEQHGLAVTPLIVALRRKADEVKSAELARAASRLTGLDAGQQRAVERLADGLVNKLLHDVLTNLKQGAVAGDAELMRAARVLFALGEDRDEPAGGASPAPPAFPLIKEP